MHNELLHVNLPPIVSSSDTKILKLDFIFGYQGWRNPLIYTTCPTPEKTQIVSIWEVSTHIVRIHPDRSPFGFWPDLFEFYRILSGILGRVFILAITDTIFSFQNQSWRTDCVIWRRNIQYYLGTVFISKKAVLERIRVAWTSRWFIWWSGTGIKDHQLPIPPAPKAGPAHTQLLTKGGWMLLPRRVGKRRPR